MPGLLICVKVPDLLPREEHRFDVGCQCPDCGGQLTHIGDDVAEVLDVSGSLPCH